MSMTRPCVEPCIVVVKSFDLNDMAFTQLLFLRQVFLMDT